MTRPKASKKLLVIFFLELSGLKEASATQFNLAVFMPELLNLLL